MFPFSMYVITSAFAIVAFASASIIEEFAIEFDHQLIPQTFALEVELTAFFSFGSGVHSRPLGLLFSWIRAAWRRQGKFP